MNEQQDDRSVYDVVFAPAKSARSTADLAEARELFEKASRPFLASPWPWLGWALVLPSTALATAPTAARFSWPGVLLLWSAAVLVGGAVEIVSMRRRRPDEGSSLATWAFRTQGNLSLVAVALSLVLLVYGRPQALAAVWLLLLGHSLYMLGGLAFRPMRQGGLVFQAGGVLSLLPSVDPMTALAVAALIGCGWISWSISRRRRSP